MLSRNIPVIRNLFPASLRKESGEEERETIGEHHTVSGYAHTATTQNRINILTEMNPCETPVKTLPVADVAYSMLC